MGVVVPRGAAPHEPQWGRRLRARIEPMRDGRDGHLTGEILV
jgi:hypothetical protein